MKKLYVFFQGKYNQNIDRILVGKFMFVLMSVAATVWFLVRVIPKPSRAVYPCMQAAAPLMSSFVIWLLSISGTYVTYKKAGKYLREKRYVMGGIFSIIFLSGIIFFTVHNSGILYSQDGSRSPKKHNPPNTPLGTGKGIFPGRVVWTHAPGAAQWDGENGFWFDDAWNDQYKADKLISAAILTLTDTVEEKDGWNKLFCYFNNSCDRGDRGYIRGENIAIKINQNNTESHKDSEEYNTSPHILLSLLRSLVYGAGIPQENITVCEPSRFITDFMFAKCFAEFPEIKYVDFEGGSGRIKTGYVSEAIKYSQDNGKMAQAIADCVMEADYLINCALLKIHNGPGVTLTAKNWYGVTSIDKYWRNNSHAGFNQDRGGKMAYRTFVDFIGHKDLGQKTLLYIIDGLYGSGDVNGIPSPKWNMDPFNGDWANSVLMSQDPLAVDAVGLDLLAAEWPQTPSLNYCDAYLVEAATIPNSPSGVIYDPERNNKPLTEPLGVMEHWNNPVDKQYS
ncbi:MAG: DUF362 domain-containing protein [Rikenellaceae bacterium]|nr:DUF362 domain-containing protein [Rikenellaceae bacterium]